MKMNPILKFGLFGLLLGCGIAGCKDSDSDTPVLPESRLTLNPGELAVPREGGEMKFTISTNRGWGMKKTGGDWFEWLREATGLASDSIVTLNVQANPDANSRIATIAVMAGTEIKELKVNQFGSEPEIVLPVPEKLVSCDGASFGFVVNANTAISGITSDPWIQTEEMATPASLCSRMYKIRVEANTGEVRNGKVTFAGENGGSAVLTIQQQAFEVKVSFTDQKMSVSGLQTEAFVTVNSNIDWTAEIIPAAGGEHVWASFQGANSGKANLPATLKFTLEQNNTGAPRMMAVIIHAGNKDFPLKLEQTIGQSKRERDSSALVALYKAAGKHGNQIWDLNKPMNSWPGVRITGAGKIRELNLEGWEFAGDIPADFGNLAELEKMSFNRCVMNGKLPEEINKMEALTTIEITLAKGKVVLPQMKELKWLNKLVMTGLTIWSAGYLVVDTYLDIENAEAIGDLSGLSYLDLSATSLTALPLSVTQLEWVHTITAAYSKMAALRPELGNMKQLKTLTINDAELQGEIPEELFNAPNLATVELSNNKLSGELKLGMFTSQSMRSLMLSNNNLTGSIPKELSTVSKINTISVRNNHLGNRMKTVKIPEEILADDRFIPNATGGEGSGQGGQGMVKPSWFGPTNICTQRDGYGWSNCPSE